MKRSLVAIALAALAGAPCAALAQAWPAKSVTLVVPFGPGGATDVVARTFAQRMSQSLGQQVVVENRAGAGGAIAANGVIKSPADGYTILLGTVSTLAVLPLMQPNIGYDVAKDFQPVGLVAKAPNVLLVTPTLPIRTVPELVAYAKANPGKLNFASSGQGTITHLIGELFKMQAGIDVQHVPYKTGVNALAEILSGQIHFAFDSIVWSLPHIQSGKLRAAGISSATRSALAPDLPTVAESMPGFEGITWYAFVAHAGVPEPIMQRLRAELAAAQQDKAVVDRIATTGAEPLVGGRAEYESLIRAETAKWSKVIKAAGIKPQ
jgi:tripartite-type tricarboxylate transporter receptor subunit TctC